jgi:hypothetical protein
MEPGRLISILFDMCSEALYLEDFLYRFIPMRTDRDLIILGVCYYITVM